MTLYSTRPVKIPTMRALTSAFVWASVALSSVGILVSRDVVRNMQESEDSAYHLRESFFPDTRSSSCRPSTTGILNTVKNLDTSRDQYEVIQAGCELPSNDFRSRITEPETFFRKPFWSNTSYFDIDDPTILVQLGGELANHLGYIARAFGLVWWLEREYGVRSNIVLRHQEASKWISARTDLTRCFPYVRDMRFEAGNTDSITKELHALNQCGPSRNIAKKRVIYTKEPFDQNLKSFVKLYAKNHSNMGEKNGYVNIPVLVSNKMSGKDHIVDKYYKDIRRIYHFEKSCCVDVPDPDESVFHFRNFVSENEELQFRAGHEELVPEQVANELFAHLNPGDKVAITSRYPNHFRTSMIVDAFKKREIQVRVIEPRSGVADFCFLMHAQKELVGTARSSFLMWAGLLGNATRVRPYTVMMPDGNSRVHHYNYTNPELKSRFLFERYNANSSIANLISEEIN